MAAARVEIPLRVVLARAPAAGRWGGEGWRAEEVRPPDGRCADGERGAPMTVTLHAKETEGYLENLETGSPSVYVVLRPGPDGRPSEPFLATACPFEAQDYADDGDSRVDAVPMPAALAARLEAFVRRHHREVPFRKRKRTPARVREAFARPPDRVRGRSGAARKPGDEDAGGRAPAEVPEPPLPDVATLGPGSDYRPFLDRRVAPEVRRLALRKLWRSDPRFANLDGLNDYDEDFGALHRRGAEVLRLAREAARRVLADGTAPRQEEKEEEAGTRTEDAAEPDGGPAGDDDGNGNAGA